MSENTGDRAVADWSARLHSQELTEGEARVVRDLLDALTTRSVITDAAFGDAMHVVQSRVRERGGRDDRYVCASREDFYKNRVHPLYFDVDDLRVRQRLTVSVDEHVALLRAARELEATGRDQVRLAEEAAEEAAGFVRGVRRHIADMLGLGSPILAPLDDG